MLLTGCFSGCGTGEPQVGLEDDQRPGFRILDLETTEVTQPGIAVAPDGQSVIISLLGHLFEMPAEGGATTQLTFGFSYDSEPVFSPDGGRVAFLSDRDGSGGNVFVLDLASQEIVQLSRELQAGSPRWSPDGETIAFFRHLLREEYPDVVGFGTPALKEMKIVPSGGGEPTVVTSPGAFGTLFYLSDGRLGWTIAEVGSGGGIPQRTRVETRGADGTTTLLASIADSLGNAVISRNGDGIYYSTEKNVRFFAFDGEKAIDLAPLSEGTTKAAIAANDSALFYGDQGKLWRGSLPEGTPESVSFNAAVKLELRKQVEPEWTPPASGERVPRAVLRPQLSPDGKRSTSRREPRRLRPFTG
jgi:hypothetical protein